MERGLVVAALAGGAIGLWNFKGVSHDKGTMGRPLVYGLAGGVLGWNLFSRFMPGTVYWEAVQGGMGTVVFDYFLYHV